MNIPPEGSKALELRRKRVREARIAARCWHPEQTCREQIACNCLCGVCQQLRGIYEIPS